MFKVGDWVRYTFPGHEKIIRVVDHNLEEFIKEYDGIIIQKWKPKEGELIIVKGKNGIITIEEYKNQINVFPFIGEITWSHNND